MYLHPGLNDYKLRIDLFLAYYVRDPESDKPYFSDVVVLGGFLFGLVDHLVVCDRLLFLFRKYFSGDKAALSWLLYLVAIARSGARKCVFEHLVSSEFVYNSFDRLVQSRRFDKYVWSSIKDAGPFYVETFPEHVSCVKRLLL